MDVTTPGILRHRLHEQSCLFAKIGRNPARTTANRWSAGNPATVLALSVTSGRGGRQGARTEIVFRALVQPLPEPRQGNAAGVALAVLWLDP